MSQQLVYTTPEKFAQGEFQEKLVSLWDLGRLAFVAVDATHTPFHAHDPLQVLLNYPLSPYMAYFGGQICTRRYSYGLQEYVVVYPSKLTDDHTTYTGGRGALRE